MDWGIAMGVITAVMLAAYLAICVWAFRGDRKADFEAAARYPLLDDGDAT